MKLIMFICTITTASVIQMSSAGMAGGWSVVNTTNSADFNEIVDFIGERLSSESNSVYVMKPDKIIDAKQQVVAGMNYKVTLTVGQTECRKNDNYDVKKCTIQSCKPLRKCVVTVWCQAWRQPKMKMTKQSCQEEPLDSSCLSNHL